MTSTFLSNFSLKFKDRIFAALYIFDCITYTIVFFSIFLFVSFLSGDHVSRDTGFFDALIFIITLVQFLRPFIALIFRETDILIRDIALAFVFGSIYAFFTQINHIYQGDTSNFSLVFKIRTTIEIFFYTIYILFTFGRVSPFLRSIKLDFLYSFTFGFVFLIFFGTWMLSLPICRNSDVPLLDLLFTATSAVTVTGLSSIDITTSLTFYGHLVLMGLIQIGGLGILTFSTFYMINLKDRLSFEERMYASGLFATKKIQDVNTLLKWIILFTLTVESVGALFLYIGSLNLHIDPSHRLFFAIFHSIAAFCNAGFSLVSSNIRYFYDNPLVLYTISAMIIFGGLGFITLLEVREKIASWFSNRNTRKSESRLSAQTKVVLILTAFFLIFGTVCFYLLEKDNVLAHMTLGEKINNAFFGSTVTRTAGFQSFSTLHLKSATIWLFIALMFIGTAPNSTGGGLKLTTFFVLLWALAKVATRRSNVQEPVWGIQFSMSLVAKAGTILFLRFSILFVAVAFMSCYESAPLSALIFEAVSAFSTVGLTQNLTSILSPPSKITLIILMFVGRVGAFYILSNIFPFKVKKTHITRKKQSFSLE